ELSPLSVFSRSGGSVFDLGVAVFGGAHGLHVFVWLSAELDAVEVRQGLVARKRELAVLVDAVLPLVDLLRRRLPGSGAERARREVDAELLRSAEQLVVLLAHLDLAAVLRDDADVQRQRLHLLEE